MILGEAVQVCFWWQLGFWKGVLWLLFVLLVLRKPFLFFELFWYFMGPDLVFFLAVGSVLGFLCFLSVAIFVTRIL